MMTPKNPVHKTTLPEPACAIATLLPAIMRQLFASDEDPAADLPLGQLRVCGLLGEGSRSMSALSRQLRVSLSALTQLADRLEHAGLVERVAADNDRRVKCLRLTAQGERVMRARAELRVRRVQAALESLSPQQCRRVLGGLETLLDACNSAFRPRTSKAQL